MTFPSPSGSPTDVGHLRIGVDIGGTGIKASLVNAGAGALAGPLLHAPTPQPAAPAAVAAVVRDLAAELRERAGPELQQASVGIAFPAIVHRGIARSAANIDSSWIGLDIEEFMAGELGCKVHALNDADAAGVAETLHGAGRDASGTVLVITLGTGIGSALMVNRQLVPNTEFGHLELEGVAAETRASAVARERDGIDWADYAVRLQRYFSHVEFLLSPDLIIVGGGISARSRDFLPFLDLNAKVVPAELQNAAGIIGAAIGAG